MNKDENTLRHIVLFEKKLFFWGYFPVGCICLFRKCVNTDFEHEEKKSLLITYENCKNDYLIYFSSDGVEFLCYKKEIGLLNDVLIEVINKNKEFEIDYFDGKNIYLQDLKLKLNKNETR